MIDFAQPSGGGSVKIVDRPHFAASPEAQSRDSR